MSDHEDAVFGSHGADEQEEQDEVELDEVPRRSRYEDDEDEDEDEEEEEDEADVGTERGKKRAKVCPSYYMRCLLTA